ncbi:sugar ABC transporter permease [Candidatus Poriferisodalis sp.]|uniref:sugar ABC transporter permease n=1 Tax=Candidatus Poriferisodalis sp. TaxID=3101277 RepID=UPI003B517D17
MSAATEASPSEPANGAPVGHRLSLSDGWQQWLNNVRVGEIGSLPVVLGLAVVAVIFQVQNDKFLSSQNLTNLIVQMAPIAMISLGIVFVLLIGEIDLSVGVMSGVGGIIIARLLIPDGNEVNWLVACAVAAAVALLVGATHGWFVAKLGVPSLIVTLATLFIGTGAILAMAGSQGLIRIQDQNVIDIANTFLSDGVGWVLAIVAVAGYATSKYLSDRAILTQGLAAQSIASFIGKVGVVAVTACGAVVVTNNNRGFPLIGVILGVSAVTLLGITERTRFGRHIYAVGGNAEAARRAGINVNRIKISCFMISSFMAAFGGLVLASRLRSADNAVGPNLLLNAIAAAVIGGTSLFGGRGRVTSAIQGALVIAAVESGMGLLGWPSDRKFIVTGCILLLAVTIDTVTRRARQSSGRA